MTTIEDWAEAVGPGWQELVWDTHKKLHHLVPDYTISQIKEKFGGLRYYYDVPRGTPEEVWRKTQEIVSTAEAKSFTICENCGDPGSPQRAGGWIMTLCATCAERQTFDGQLPDY